MKFPVIINSDSFTGQASEVSTGSEGGEAGWRRPHPDEEDEVEVMPTNDAPAPAPDPAPATSAVAAFAPLRRKKPQDDPVVTLLKKVSIL